MIFLLQHLGFVISLKKCVLDPGEEIELLELILNPHAMTLSLPNEKIVKIKDQCLSFYKASEVSLLDLKKTNRYTFFKLSRSAPGPSTVLLLTTTESSISKTNTQSYLTLVKLTPMAKNELLWWINNPELCNGRLVIQPQTQFLIQTDASKKGWRPVC